VSLYGLKIAIAYDCLGNVLRSVDREHWRTKLIENMGASTSISDIVSYLIYRSKTVVSVMYTDSKFSLVEIYDKYSYGGIDHQCQKLKSNMIKLINIIEEQQRIFGVFKSNNVLVPKIESLIRDYGRAQRYIGKFSKQNGWVTSSTDETV
jgi:hypothetical protein